MNKMIPLLLQNKSFSKNNFIPFYVFNFKRSNRKMEPPWWYKIQN
jgi:hypothetical protein